MAERIRSLEPPDNPSSVEWSDVFRFFGRRTSLLRTPVLLFDLAHEPGNMIGSNFLLDKDLRVGINREKRSEFHRHPFRKRAGARIIQMCISPTTYRLTGGARASSSQEFT